MARNDATHIPEFELLRERPDFPARNREALRGEKIRPSVDEDLPSQLPEDEEESPFLRTTRRVPVRRGPLAKQSAKMRFGLIAGACVLVLGGLVYCVTNYLGHDARFRIESSDDIEINGLQHVTRSEVLHLLGDDISCNLFHVRMDENQQKLEQMPWVESATIMRLLPNRLRVDIQERTPVAFVQSGNRVQLIDANGVMMGRPHGDMKYSFPVITGISESDPISVRAARMKIYRAFITDIDSDGANHSHDISEVDVSEPEDVKGTVEDPSGAVLVHFGSGDFYKRYQTYMTHIQEWRQQFPRIASVDLRYERQIVVNPGPSAGNAAMLRDGVAHGQ